VEGFNRANTVCEQVYTLPAGSHICVHEYTCVQVYLNLFMVSGGTFGW
jgi:hypothetical protein